MTLHFTPAGRGPGAGRKDDTLLPPAGLSLGCFCLTQAEGESCPTTVKASETSVFVTLRIESRVFALIYIPSPFLSFEIGSLQITKFPGLGSHESPCLSLAEC